MTATLNDKPLLKAAIREPRIGAWAADLEVDAADAITGSATTTIDGVSWTGTVLRGDIYAGRLHLKVIGGAGGLSKEIGARGYVNSTLGAILADIMAETGEKLSPLCDPSLLVTFVARWTRPKGSAGLSIRQVADEAKCSWRVLRDGTVWLGPETWLPPASTKYDITDTQPQRGLMTVAPTAPVVLPGSTFEARKVSTVTTAYESEATRQDIHFEDAKSGGFDRVFAQVAGFVEACVGRRIDYSQLYPSTVISQNDDGTIDLLPDDPRMRGNGHQKVALWHGLPGCTVLVKNGARVKLGFDNGDPKLPYAALWPDGSGVTQITFKADVKLVVDSDFEATGDVKSGGSISALGDVTALDTGVPGVSVSLGTHTHSGVTTGPGVSGSPVPGS